MTFHDLIYTKAKNFGIEFSNNQIEQFIIYYNLLSDWNKKINLTALETEEDFAVKHVIDSLSCYSEIYFPHAARVVDVGTGAGFPGIPLKIFRPDLNMLLLDSLAKRVNFLNTVITELNLANISAAHNRAEDAAHLLEYREVFDIACSRAVARLPILLEYCLPFVKVGGYFIALKGAQYSDELGEAKNALQQLGGAISDVKLIKLPGIDDTRAVIYIVKEKSTNSRYPRKSNQIKKKHL